MAGSASPIDIATSRQSSGSPRGQQSNLTTQLQQPSINVRHDDGMEPPQIPTESQYRGRQESIGMLGTTPYGARSIPSKDGFRRESNVNALAGSLMQGMSWGGISVGSFIRDDMMMTGTSPYNFQSPSFHSSSYLPKMEANYMKDYVCCDIRLDSMHELLQHYEEAHAAQPTQTMGRTPKEQQYPSSRAANATSTAQAVQQQAQVQPANLMPQPQMQQPTNFQTSPLFSGQSGEQVDFENLDGMDMDTMQSPQGAQFQPQPQFGRQQPRGPSVNVNIANAFQGQGLQTPTTPRPGQQNMGLPHNPTVSSVNTPTLMTQTASQQTGTPDSSMPSTPAEPAGFDYNQLGNMGLTNFDYQQLLQNPNIDLNSLDLAHMNNGGSGTIDDPAKRLLSKQGYGNKGTPNQALMNSNSSELAKRIRESQLLNGLAGVGGFVGEEIKPFKCPVIGCEKAYKNQNGLKYHKQHGHQNQQLKENVDGTFSIVDPNTSIPYPGTIGMEKEKPYRCDVCGKRYKNLNGLKYHRQHSPPCNPELKLDAAGMQGLPNNAQGMNANVAQAPVMNDMTGY
ncbi:Transcriptional regulator of ribosomal biogenesis proteins [Recurvomyces mirabilis]|uniref:Transcriptional regulator of ribosomal biogenesis proteins n=1 Tax=Recurvomyces mirabilis TaxID=574656 RepID=A0AAE1BYK2_9PEZI|nr:Transcriptional regulator of ribosomal biogenesis proteins [Recurvomyces mirabilis]KAK5155015.1 Transcriptional regulator of ribosomal biogenesis proteins [Recurvomyces mirabilis]